MSDIEKRIDAFILGYATKTSKHYVDGELKSERPVVDHDILESMHKLKPMLVKMYEAMHSMIECSGCLNYERSEDALAEVDAMLEGNE